MSEAHPTLLSLLEYEIPPDRAQVVVDQCKTAQLIARIYDACVLIIHHTKKGEKTARGSGAIKANLDLEALVEKIDTGGSATYKLSVTKNKNGVEGHEFSWHIPQLDAPFIEGKAPTGFLEPTSVGERCAEVAGLAIREIASSTHAVSKSELYATMRERSPELFLREGKPDSSRQSRALNAAIAAGYIIEQKGKYRVGPSTPPSPLAGPPANLDDLTARAAL